MVSSTEASKPSRRPTISLVCTGGVEGNVCFIKSAEVAETIVIDLSASRPGLALVDAFRRCRGELIAIAGNRMSFAEGTFEAAVAAFSANPDAGGVCFEDFLFGDDGNSIADVSIVTLLLKSARLCLPAGFVRRSALLSVGLEREDWAGGSVGLDLWCRIVTDFDVVTLDRRALETPPTTLVFEPVMADSRAMIETRLRLVGRHFSSSGFFDGKAQELELESKICQIFSLHSELKPIPGSAVDDLLTSKRVALLRELHALLQVDHRALTSFYRLISARGRSRAFRRVMISVLKWIAGSPSRFALHLGYSIWNAPHRSVPFFGHWLMRALIRSSPPLTYLPQTPDALPLTDAYSLAGIQYEARGQIASALAMWAHAQHDHTIDSLACQAHLKNPPATDESLADVQRKWAARHIGNKPNVTRPRGQVNPKIRIGYHCAFMGNDTIRHMMRNVFLAHDRTRFEVFGY
ncbi:MAG: hypothetical protein WCK17_19325, partial [Verrucomicrobiota bacterium]